MDFFENVFLLFFNCISHRFAIIFLHNSFQSPPLSQWGRIAHRIIFAKIRKYLFFLSVFRRKRLDSFCRNCCSCLWFAFSLWTSPQPNSEASLQTNNALFTIVCLLFVQIMFVDQILGLQVVRAWLPCVDLPWCPAPPPLRCKPAAELDRCSLRTATPGPNTRMRVTLGMIEII